MSLSLRNIQEHDSDSDICNSCVQHNQLVTQISEYTQTKISGYLTSRISDRNLWEQFQHDFKDISIDEFKSLQFDVQQRLRIVLRCGGVYVPPHTKVDNESMADMLYKVAHEDEPIKWEMEHLKFCRDDFHHGIKLGMITSRYFEVDEGDAATPVTLLK